MANFTSSGFPGAAETITSADVAWQDLANVIGDSGDRAKAPLTNAADTSEFLLLTDYGFSLPSFASVTGVTAVFSLMQGKTAGHAIETNSVRLYSGAFVGNAKSDATTWSTTAFDQTHGDSTDKWGTTLTPGIVNSSDFGVGLQAYDDTVAAGTQDAYAYSAQLAISYTAVPQLAPTYPTATTTRLADLSINDAKATRLNFTELDSSGNQTQWELREPGGNSFYIRTDAETTPSGSVLGGNLTTLDLWLPPATTYEARARRLNGNYDDWSAWTTVVSLGYVNSYEKYEILNRGTISF